MAKLRLPLLSLEARGAIGESIVFFPWKGINAARKYVVPSNPKTTAQNTQRDYVTRIVAKIHDAQGLAVDPLIAIDTIAYALYSRTLGRTMTWFNAAVKQAIDQKVAAKQYLIFRDGAFTAGAGQVTCHLEMSRPYDMGVDATAGTWNYGTSPTALNTSSAATIVADSIDNIIAGLSAGVKYYFQFRATAAAAYVGVRSGIYTATPT